MAILSDKAILAYFREFEQASRAADMLNQRGDRDVQVSAVSQFAGGPEPVRRQSIHGYIPSLAELTLGEGLTDRDESPLAAVHPDDSGMADTGGFDEVGMNWLLTAVVPEGETDEVVRMLRQLGAQV